MQHFRQIMLVKDDPAKIEKPTAHILHIANINKDYLNDIKSSKEIGR